MITKKISFSAALILSAFLNSAWADAQTDDGAIPTNRTPQLQKSAKAKVERNPLEVNPAIALRETQTKEINLPGVMKIQGESVDALDFTRARKIQMNNGGAVTIYVSATDPNRIQLPFANPTVIGRDDLKVDKRASSNNIYVSFIGSSKTPAPLFIETAGGNGPVLTLQLVPKNIVSQTYIVEDVAQQTAEQAKQAKSSEYITATQALMETVALGAFPSGYSLVELKIPPIGMNGLMVEVDKKLSSRDGDIYVYTVTNPGAETTTVKEEEFDGDLVQAISVFPRPTLRRGESTKVIVSARKEAKKGN
jgi:conjugal transfer pilus assembly protein TraK